FRPGLGGAHLTGCVDAVERRHRDVEDDDVGIERFRGSEKLPAIGHDPDHVKMRLQQAPQPFRDDAVVVGQQYPRPCHDCLLRIGTRIVIFVPSPLRDWTVRRALIRRARSRMLSRPTFVLPLAATSKPTPQSRTHRTRSCSFAISRTVARLAWAWR